MTVTADDSKWKESVKDSTYVEIADNCMEEKNDDYSKFPKNSENHTCNEEGAKKRKKRKNKDSLSETEQKESDRDSSDQEIADDGLEEKNEDNMSQKFIVWTLGFHFDRQ